VARWSPMDTAPKDGSRIRVKTTFGEDTARWHSNGLWVAGWAPISFNDAGQPKAWRSQTDVDDVADREQDLAERHKALSKLKNSDLFLKSIELQWEKEFGS
jgi:hypothetical protein